jgi:hypothetical protein
MMAIKAGCVMAIVKDAGGEQPGDGHRRSAWRDPKRRWPPRWSHGSLHGGDGMG